MSATSFIGGRAVIYRRRGWCYADTDLLAKWPPDRPCPECGLGYAVCVVCGRADHDPCLGHMNGIDSVCCGHGGRSPEIRH